MFIHLLLAPLAWLFGVLVGLKNLFFDLGFFQVKTLDKPVISVGNLAMGGTGKSPVCMALLEILSREGLRVAVLSRGYGRRFPKTSRWVEPFGDWTLYGDEPSMIARRFPQVRVYVGPTRWEAAQQAVDWNPDLFLIDDGFQHRQLARDLDLVLIDVSQPKPKLFPQGMFRESWPALKRADAVVLTRCPPHVDLSQWYRSIHAVRPHLPILELDFKAEGLRRLDGKQAEDLEALRHQSLAVYTGIARPAKFLNTLQKLGAKVTYSLLLKDHQPLDLRRKKRLIQACHRHQIDFLITTEKDAVKLENNANFDILVRYLSIGVEWRDKTRIQNILKQVQRMSYDQEIVRKAQS